MVPMEASGMNEQEPLSMPELAAAIQFPGDARGRRLLRELEARERSNGVQFITRLDGPVRTHPRCTIAALRLHCPDLLRRDQDDVRRAFEAHLRAVEERTKELVADEVARQIERRRS